MLLKQTNTNRGIFKNVLNILKKKKVLVIGILFILYTTLSVGMGYVLQRHDFYGLVMKPMISKNYGMVLAYFKSFSVDPESLIIDIKHKDFLKLAYKRQEALKAGILLYSEDDWVPATLTHRRNRVKADIRLKGTAPTHWKDKDVWSFKVKVKGGNTLFGMRRFALQKPSTRTFMNEWYWHKLLRYSGLIALRYDFISLTVNGKNLPIYAIEENFEKKLIENNNLREGPIFRAHFVPFSPYYNSGELKSPLRAIDIYQYNQYTQNAEFLKLAHLAESRIEAYRQGDLPFFKVFDVNKMGKLLALTDLVGSRHTLPSTNLRFYFNPVTGLIEPIAYDATIPLSRAPKFNFVGAGSRFEDRENKNENRTWPLAGFRDKLLFKTYIESLEEISNEKFLDRFFLSLKKEAQEKQKILNRSFPYYEFNPEGFYKNSKHIKKNIQPSKSLNVFFEGVSSEEEILYLDIANILNLPVEVLGVSLDGDNIIKPFQENIIQSKRVKSVFYHVGVVDQINPLPSLTSMKKAVLKEVKTLASVLPMVSVGESKMPNKLTRKKIPGLEYKRIAFKVPRELKWSDSLVPRLRVVSKIFGASFQTANEIIPWARHEDIFLQPPNVKEIPFMSVEENDKLIRVNSGSWVVEQDIIIPKGYRVIATEGTRLRLVNGSKIISYSAIEFNGSQDQPVVISSQKYSGQGIVVMNANEKSILTHTIFNGLSNPKQGGWALTGAVSFYESPVEFSNVEFNNSRSEDGLNIVRSTFILKDVVFSGMSSDALDVDFSNGTMKNVSFWKCGNDALDASGSQINVESIFFNAIGDKGVSAGEKSQITIEILDGKNSRIAVASKDQSEVFIKKAKIENSQIGFTAFQKKKQFGPGTIEVQSLEANNLETLFLIEEGSTMKNGGSPVKDRVKAVGEFLYN